MKIDGPKTARPVGPARKSDRAGSSGGVFSVDFGDEGGDGDVPSIRAPARVGVVDALLSIQEVGDEQGNSRKARARGAAMLERLDDLRLGLLAGEIPREQLDGLVELIQSERAAVTDPQLTEILDEIDLRVQVELAKLDAS